MGIKSVFTEKLGGRGQRAFTAHTATPTYYVPQAIRPPSLISICCMIVICIALLEHAVRRGIPVTAPPVKWDKNLRRQANASTTIGTDTITSIPTVTTSPDTATQSLTSAINRSNYISITTDQSSIITTTNKPTDSTVVVSTETPPPLTVSAVRSSNYIAIETTTTSANRASSVSSDAYIVIETATGTTSANLASSVSSGAYIVIETATTSANGDSGKGTATDKASGDVVTSGAANTVIPDSKTSGTSNRATSGIPTGKDGQISGAQTTVTSGGTTAVIVVSTSASVATLITKINNTPTTVLSTSYEAVTTSYRISQASKSIVLMTSKFTSTNSAGSVIVGTATLAVSTTNPTETDIISQFVNKSELQLGEHFEQIDYFYAMYLCVFVAIVLKTTWSVVFAATKLMEPFYQLAQPGGSPAQRSLMSDYLSRMSSLISLNNLFRGHWVMFTVTFVHLLMAALPPLATECMHVRATAKCANAAGTGYVRCNPVWILDLRIIRCIQAFLSLMLIFILTAIWLNWRRLSGIFANPASIASMAALFRHPGVISDVRRLDPLAQNPDIAKALAGELYSMGGYHAGGEQERYGVTRLTDSPWTDDLHDDRSSPATGNENTALKKAMAIYTSIPVDADMPQSQVEERSHHKKHMVVDGIFLATIIGLFGVLMGYYLDYTNSGFNTFFSSDAFGPRFILTSWASILNARWQDLEREVRVSTPYRRLAQRHARPQDTILVNMNGTPISGVVTSAYRQEWFRFMVSLVTVLSDVLIIAVGGVPFSSAQIHVAYLASTYISITILGIEILVVVALFFWRRDNARMMIPREPETLVNLWMGLCNEGNSLRREFAGTEQMNERERNHQCIERDDRYWGGWMTCDDGKKRWVVDREGEGIVAEY